MVVRAFRKCGISVAADGSEDYKINLKELEDYEAPVLENSDTQHFQIQVMMIVIVVLLKI